MLQKYTFYPIFANYYANIFFVAYKNHMLYAVRCDLIYYL